MVLPAGFALPPLPYLLFLIVGVGAVGYLLSRRSPPVTEPVVLGLVPWIMLGAALHVLYQVGLAPSHLRPLFGTPSVYLTTFILAGIVWLGSGPRAAESLAASGAMGFLVVVGILFAARPVAVGLPLLGLVLSIIIGALVWFGLQRVRPEVEITGWIGALVIFAHSIDGVSTAIGVDILGFGERTPASRLVLEVGGMLPTADLLGVGWLFVLVKLVVATLVVWLFADYVREDPHRGRLLLALIAAVGLGPGIHNLLLYTVA